MNITVQWTALIMLMVTSMFGQGSFTLVIELDHSALPFERRVTSAGVFSVASFDVEENTLYVNSYDSPTIYAYRNGKFVAAGSAQARGTDFVMTRTSSGVQVHSIGNDLNSLRSNATLRKTTPTGSGTMIHRDGRMRSADGQEISMKVPDRSHLVLSVGLRGIARDIVLPFPNNLGYAECIGADSSNAFYLLAETYAQEIPLAVNRYIYVVTAGGSIQSIVSVPTGNQLSLLKEFVVDRSGDLYHLFATGEKLQLLKWSGLNTQHADTLYYPGEYYRFPHLNLVLPIDEPQAETGNPAKILGTRTYALQLAEQYVYHTFRITEANLAPQGVTAPDGNGVVTPNWLVVGMNAHIPYKWGGFSTLEQFDIGLQDGCYAGDIDMTSPSAYAVGVDCSGFVCRCWGLGSHYSTYNMVGITTAYDSWDQIKPGDAMHTLGHVRLFIERTPNGGLRVAESSGRYVGVFYWTYTLSGVGGYTPRYLYYMPADIAESRPILRSVLASSDTTVIVRWKADTTDVAGYRVYTSGDGTTWSLLHDETTVKTESVTVVIHQPTFFRVSRVLRDDMHSESMWSTVLGASLKGGSPRALIVDAFENEAGNWQGPGHNFVMRYGSALADVSQPFESAHNNEVTAGTTSLTGRPMVIWFTGNESVEGESISAAEQSVIAKYLEAGGRLFVNGSDIGYDLWDNGTTADKNFYTQYLKASYNGENDYISTAEGNPGTIFSGHAVRFGQNYQEYYPDIVEGVGGSLVCLKYSNGKGSGIQYTGTFGSSSVSGRLVYIGFPLETIADDSCFKAMVASVNDFFQTGNLVEGSKEIPGVCTLSQNYPNPFNPTTVISYQLPANSKVRLEIYDMLGREVATLVNEEQPAGRKELQWNAEHVSSGIYFYRLTAGGFVQTRKMMVVK